jgi:hypothetical protein
VNLRSLLLVLATVSGSTGCLGASEKCTEPVAVQNPQGQDYRCIASEDCPRAANEALCVSEPSSAPECIRCLNTTCVRITPETCS